MRFAKLNEQKQPLHFNITQLPPILFLYLD